MHTILGTVDGCGYDGQQKYTICDACRPCHSIWRIARPVFHRIRRIRCVLMSHSGARSRDLAFLLTTTMTKPIILPLAHAHRVMKHVEASIITHTHTYSTGTTCTPISTVHAHRVNEISKKCIICRLYSYITPECLKSLLLKPSYLSELLAVASPWLPVAS